MTPMVSFALYIIIRVLAPTEWHVLGVALMVCGFGYFNFIVIGISISQTLEAKFVREDADWSGWHTAGLVKESIGGFIGFLVSILLLMSHLEQYG